MKISRMGTIYIVKNPHYRENYYKVGKTSRTAEDRLRDTKKPSAFSLEDGSVVIAEYAVYNLNKVESLIHEALFKYKIDTNKKEWFKIELTELKKIINDIVSENNFTEIEEPPNENNISKEGKENFTEAVVSDSSQEMLESSVKNKLTISSIIRKFAWLYVIFLLIFGIIMILN